MSILDDAIREHLELKRAHGADDVELKKLEDEAFGPPQRPDDPGLPAEAPTEFLAAPEIGAGEAAAEAQRPAPNIADLQEAPEFPKAPEPEVPQAAEPEPPAEEEHPAMEHEVIADGGHSTEERHAIAEQPTELFDVQGEFDDAGGEAEAPSEEQLIDAELAEPRLAPVDPLAGIDGAAEAELEISDQRGEGLEEDEDDFFSEQRLSDELNQALETPAPGEPTAFPPTEEAAAVVEFEDAAVEQDEDVEEEGSGEFAQEEDSGEYAVEEDEGEGDFEEEPEPPAAHEQATEIHRLPEPPPPAPPKEDLLEDTPDFLEDAPEDDNLWFEQKPPKDFDFDD
jgi:hypothetical protein